MQRTSFAFRSAFACVIALSQAGICLKHVKADDQEQIKRWEKAFEDDVLPIVREKCIECHDGSNEEGGFNVTRFMSGAEVTKKLDIWDDVGKRVRLKEMPPEGSPQLSDDQKAKFHRWLDSKPKQDVCSQIANDETQAWYRGFVMSRRLTRTEYLNAMRDLLGMSVDPSLEIPSDGAGGEGFDTNGDTLFTSPIHIEQYVAIASTMVDAQASSLIGTPAESVDESDAAKTVISAFARRAWRRPIAQEETDRLLKLYHHQKQNGADFVSAVAEPLKAILVSPHFLFVVESEAPEGGVQRLTPHQLATRLALFIWSSVPDEELLSLADKNELDTEPQILVQVRRMLKDPKARALGENFGMQWLGLTNFLSSVRPDQEVYPEYSAELAKDLHEEAVTFVASIFREDQSLLNLIDSRYTYLNGSLAKHYGISLPNDAPWQKVTLDSGQRGGVITLGAALMASSYPRRTSPVLRGRWVLEEVLGSKVPPPPPNVPALEEAAAEKVMTLRERLEIHRKNPDCAACHNRMDPLGFGLENFDGLGRWRDKDHDLAIDSSGQLPSGETFNGPEELKQILLRRSGEVERHLVRKMLGFALGRELNQFDDCVIDDCMKRLNAEDHRGSIVIETIALSFPFQHRYFKAATKAEP